MELKKNSDFEQIVGQMKSTDFAIDESAQAIIMDSLINLYSDPIGSIVREATSNCIDAYRERELKATDKIPLDKGDDKKWFSKKQVIELLFTPKNSLLGVDNIFIFRDHGIGLSEARVKEIYTKFGNSTKRTNNYQIGGFGIGAKAPFSYADTFYVRTKYNGTEYTYMLYRGSSVPSMDLVSKKPTKELNGTDVIIPLQDDYDKNKFREAINSQLQYFENIVYKGIEENCGTIIEPNIIYADSNVIMDDNTSTAGILVGNVQYPINWNLIERSEIYCGALLRFEVGELDLVPSRENIRYTEKTKLLIQQRIATIKSVFSKQIQEELRQEKDLFKFIRKACDVKKMVSGSYYGRGGDSLISKKAYISGKSAMIDLSFIDSNGEEVDLKGLDFQKLFEWIEIQRVTTTNDSRYVGGKKLAHTKVNDWNTFFDTHFSKKDENGTFVREPIYYVEETYARKKDFYIIKNDSSVSGTFLRFKVKNESRFSGSSSDSKPAFKDEAFIELFINSPVMRDYTTLDMTEKDVEEDVGLFESEQDRRKREEKVFVKTLVNTHKTWERNVEGRVAFTGTEHQIGEIEDMEDTIVYGFSEHDLLLKELGGLLTSGEESKRGNHNYLMNDHSIRVYKIAASAEKYFTNHIYIKDFFMEKHILLKQYYTAYLLDKDYDKWRYLEGFVRYNQEIYDDWATLTDFVTASYERDSRIELTKEFKEEIFSMCSEESLILPELIEKQKILNKYSEGLELLNYIPDLIKVKQNKVFVEKIREYLTFLNKTIVEPEGVTRESIKGKAYAHFKEKFIKGNNSVTEYSWEQYAKDMEFTSIPEYKKWVKDNPHKSSYYDNVPILEAREDWPNVKKIWFNTWYETVDEKVLVNIFDEELNIFITFKNKNNEQEYAKSDVLYSL
tara:strand:- start:8681 stop:11377 length:2697 start_codon:yes stop_codon:yes gene_type:complete